MTDRHRPATSRTYQRRRLAVLVGVLAAVLAAAPFIERSDASEEVATVASADPEGDQRVRIAALGSPTAVRELLSETATTIVAATGSSTTTSTVPPSTTAPSTTAPPTTAPPTTTAAAPTSTAAPTTTAAPSPAASPTTTAAPRPTAPPTTAAPTTTTTAPPRTTTTTAPPTTERRDGGYAYDDPRSTQVWYDLARCESGGNWSINTGNGYYGGLQFALSSWRSVGGTGYPHEHPAQTQIDRGRDLQARQGWGAWPHCSEQLGLR